MSRHPWGVVPLRRVSDSPQPLSLKGVVLDVHVRRTHVKTNRKDSLSLLRDRPHPVPSPRSSDRDSYTTRGRPWDSR